MKLALVHSPALGPLCWEGVARSLGDQGVALDYGGVEGPDWHDGAGARIAALLQGEPIVLVAHSGAGGLVPSIVDAVGARVRGVVLVDALLPHPGRPWAETVAPPFLAALLGKSDNERLPPWNAWFPQDPTERLIPDEARRRRFNRDLPKLPVAYVTAKAPRRTGWEDVPTGYLQLSRAYDEEAAAAERQGWIVDRLESHHLAMVTEPAIIAVRLDSIVRRLLAE